MQLKNLKIAEPNRFQEGFTLIEMLIVVVILSILMTMVFRLGTLGTTDRNRTNTVVRLQRIENCLSGYYAAFGSYPPVRLHASRDIYYEVDENGDQNEGSGAEQNQTEGSVSFAWAGVKAACRAQPFGCEYPGNEQDRQAIEDWSKELQERANNSSDFPEYGKSAYAHIYQQGFSTATFNDFTGNEYANDSYWGTIKIFKFGVMSYLLPRYLFMMGGDAKFFGVGAKVCAQWDSNNDMPSDPFEGTSFEEAMGGTGSSGWEKIRNYSQSALDDSQSRNQRDLAHVANIPSQAVCARWMPNLEKICSTIRTLSFFGVYISDPSDTGLGLPDTYAPEPRTHYPPNSKKAYRLASVTIEDAWGEEFYYYSPAPYQSYVAWSAGANQKTFPPWMPIEKLTSTADKECAVTWKSDDIVKMSH